MKLEEVTRKEGKAFKIKEISQDRKKTIDEFLWDLMKFLTVLFVLVKCKLVMILRDSNAMIVIYSMTFVLMPGLKDVRIKELLLHVHFAGKRLMKITFKTWNTKEVWLKRNKFKNLKNIVNPKNKNLKKN